MSELSIKIKAPYSITLMIDSKRYIPDENGEYKIRLDAETEHRLKILIQKSVKTESVLKKIISCFKWRKKYQDKFDDLVYSANFKLASKYKNSRIVFEYKKQIASDYENREISIPCLSVMAKNRIDIYDTQKNIFINRNALWSYIIRHRWLESLIYFFMIFNLIYAAIRDYSNYKNNIELDHYLMFVSTYKQSFIMDIIIVIPIITFMIYRIVKFIKMIKSTQRTGQRTGDGSLS